MHGGKREGAGRPRTFGDVLCVPRTVRLPEHAWDEMKRRADAEAISVAQYLMKALRLDAA